MSRKIHIVHVIYQFSVGGLENGVINLINGLPEDRYQHSIVALTFSDPVFARRLQREVTIYPVRKKPGHDFSALRKVFQFLRKAKPDIVHTRNLAAADMLPIAWLTRVPARIHSIHGRDVHDLDGTNTRYRVIQRILTLFSNRVIALSKDLEEYMRDKVGVSDAKLVQVYNGVNTERFAPGKMSASELLPDGFRGDDLMVIGYVGRLEAVKSPQTLCRAFVQLDASKGTDKVRLVIVGEGSQQAECEEILRAAGLREKAWFAGSRSDVSELMDCFDIFALSSLAEGISNTILEAMAKGLPIVATDVGGNAELVNDGETGLLVASGDDRGFSRALDKLLCNKPMREQFGAAGLARANQTFSLPAMVSSYDEVYTQVIGSRQSG